jgi:hypothetical protein
MTVAEGEEEGTHQSKGSCLLSCLGAPLGSTKHAMQRNHAEQHVVHGTIVKKEVFDG